SLLEDVAAEPSEARDAVGDVDLGDLLEPLLLAVIHDREGHRERVLGRGPRRIDDRLELAVDGHEWEAPGLYRQVGGALAARHRKKVIDPCAHVAQSFAENAAPRPNQPVSVANRTTKGRKDTMRSASYGDHADYDDRAGWFRCLNRAANSDGGGRGPCRSSITLASRRPSGCARAPVQPARPSSSARYAPSGPPTTPPTSPSPPPTP